MSSPDDKKKRSDQETLDAVFDEAELDEHVDDLAKMSPEEIARELAGAGVDVEAARAEARRQLAARGGDGAGAKVVSLASRRYRTLMWVAAAAVLLLAIGYAWRERFFGEVIVSRPPCVLPNEGTLALEGKLSRTHADAAFALE